MKFKGTILVILVILSGFFASETLANSCPTFNPSTGVGCTLTNKNYFCNGSCQVNSTVPSCSIWTPSPIIAHNYATTTTTGIRGVSTDSSACTAADACGVCSTCDDDGSYPNKCGSYPNIFCKADFTPISGDAGYVANCNTYDACTEKCATCAGTHSLCAAQNKCYLTLSCPGQTFNVCTGLCEGVISTVKLDYDSGGINAGTTIKQSAFASPVFNITKDTNTGNSFIGIGSTSPSTFLSFLSDTGSLINMGGGRIKNLGNPILGSDAVNKDYADSIITTVASSSFWKQLGSSVYYNEGSVGIGTTVPNQQLEITKNFRLPTTRGATPYGIIYKDNTPFIHDFSYGLNGNSITPVGGNLFIGGAGNFSMGSTATDPGQSSYNYGIGSQALGMNTTGQRNIAIGLQSLLYNTTGDYNFAFGLQTLIYNTTGSNNFGLGHASLYWNTTGSNNLAFGNGAGSYIADGSGHNVTGSNSVLIGNNVKVLADNQTNQIVIGYNATGIGSNSVVLGNNSITTTALKGNVGIGTTTPLAKLHIKGISTTDQTVTVQGASSQTSYLIDWLNNSGTRLGGIIASGELRAGNFYAGSPSYSFLADADIGMYRHDTNVLGFSTSGTNRMVIDATGNVGIGTTTPSTFLSFLADTGSSVNMGGGRITKLGNPILGTDAVNKDYTDSLVASSTAAVSSVGKFVGATTATSTGSNAPLTTVGYNSANDLCKAQYPDSHVCATSEIMNTISTKSTPSIPNASLWIFNGPPGFTATANDCLGRRDAASANFGTIWYKSASTGEGYGSLAFCNDAYKLACCK